jgi:hypothetical protein
MKDYSVRSMAKEPNERQYIGQKSQMKDYLVKSMAKEPNESHMTYYSTIKGQFIYIWECQLYMERG